MRYRRWPLLLSQLLCLGQLLAHCRGLVCMVCRQRSSSDGLDHNQVGNSRVTMRNARPYCAHLEPIECDRDQDLCVTIRMNLGVNAGWWILMGCESRDSITFSHTGCERFGVDAEKTSYDKQSSGKRLIEQHHMVQDVCFCDHDKCNSSSPLAPSLLLLIALALSRLVSRIYPRYP